VNLSAEAQNTRGWEYFAIFDRKHWNINRKCHDRGQDESFFYVITRSQIQNLLSEYLQQRKQTIYTVINIQNIDKDTHKIIPHETQFHQHSNFVINSLQYISFPHSSDKR